METMETIKIIKPGIYTTIQDLGRCYYQEYGMPVSGAMDELALRVGNILVGNPQNAPAIEFNYPGLEVEFLADVSIAITGGEFLPKSSDGREIGCWKTYLVNKGTKLSFPKVKRGCRGYLFVAGGFDIPKIMGSYATYARAKIGGFEGRPLKPGDVLHAKQIDSPVKICSISKQQLASYYPKDQKVRVIKGPQDHMFTERGLNTFFTSAYKITRNSDRMGYGLEGPALEHKAGADIISDGIPKGAIQVPGNGMPVILMADRQTIGGYTKIANIITVDLHRVAQMKPGDLIEFREVSVDEAHKLLVDFEESIKLLISR